jgi:N-acetyltransferase 10
LTKELGLPSNQVLAMFNKAVRKISIAMYNIVEDKEKENLLGGKERLKAQEAVESMRDVASKTLEEDAKEAAHVAFKQLTTYEEKVLPPEIANDASLMQYAIKGTDDQWSQALDGMQVNEAGTVSIRSVREKRKNVDAEDIEKEGTTERKMKKSKKKKSRRQ